MSKTATAAKPEGKCKALWALWDQAGGGELLPRAFAVEMGIAEGFNPSTCRTQFERWRAKFGQASAPTPEAQETPAQ